MRRLRARGRGAEEGRRSRCRSPRPPARERRLPWPMCRPRPVSKTVVDAAVREFGGIDVLVNNVGAREGRRSRSDHRRGMAGGVRSDAVSGDPHVAPGRAAHPQAGRRRDRHRLVDLRPRVGRPHDLQRREGGGDQPDEVAGAATGEGSDPRRLGRARIDPVRGRIVVEAAAGRSRGHCDVRRNRSCRSAGSARPKKSARRSRSSPRRRPAGSAARRSSSTAVSRGCSSVLS